LTAAGLDIAQTHGALPVGEIPPWRGQLKMRGALDWGDWLGPASPTGVSVSLAKERIAVGMEKTISQISTTTGRLGLAASPSRSLKGASWTHGSIGVG
jgi:hypothetical protein